jgi:hypothetical protein
MKRWLTTAAGAIALGASTGPLVAAEPACDFVITAAPYTASQPGLYCLGANLTYNALTGAAVTIAANSVTLDLRGYKIGGQGAGAGTGAYGIQAEDRNTVTVRNGLVRGFLIGVLLMGRANRVEDVHADANTLYGIYTEGDMALIRRCLVTSTGGSAIYSTAATGIAAFGDFNHVRENVVTGLIPTRTGTGTFGVYVFGGQVVDNQVICGPSEPSIGLNTQGVLKDNTATVCTTPFGAGTKVGTTNFP